MSTIGFILLCIQACLIENIYTQYARSSMIGNGMGFANGLASGIGLGALGLNTGIGASNVGAASVSAAGIGGTGIGAAGIAPTGMVPSAISSNSINAANIGINGAYGGLGTGDVAVAGELPVAGSTIITGHVPIIGAVSFNGNVPAGGTVSVTGSCGCGCNGGVFYK